jgi:hypothetical protein
MPILTDLRARVFSRLKARPRRTTATPAPASRDGGEKRAMACQSLCLNCDARTPCTLGRLIG